MPHIVTCITREHDLGLVVLAGLVCLLASVTAFGLIQRGSDAPSARARTLWTIAAAVVGGTGVWATHFVAMLAYRPGFPFGYELSLTVVSAGVAVAVIGAGCFLSHRGSGWAALGGAVAGAGIAAMHYVGMAAVDVAADIFYDPLTVLLSVAIGMSLGGVAFSVRQRRPDLTSTMMAGGLFALAICALHFTAMSAVTIVPVPTRGVDAVIDPKWMAIAIAAVTLIIVILGFAGSSLDRRMAERDHAEAERLRDHVQQLETAKTELEATAATLQSALAQAGASNRAKSQFLATMSHELRTPLNAVIGFSELIQTEMYGPLGDRRYREYVDDIHASGSHLLSLINDILDFAKIDAGRLALAEEEVDIAALCAASVCLIAGAAQDAGLTLEREIEPGIFVRGDERRLKQVLLNLLSNAIKFTPAPGTVSLAAHRVGDEVVLSVSDTGIDAADIPQALEPFGQVDSRLARSHEGAGLGLPLCRQLVELHGGVLSIDSTPGTGTTVSATLPSERVLPAPPTYAAAAE